MSSGKDTYIIARDASEASRLDVQHRCMISCQGYYLHPDIPIPSTHARIADLCTGTAIWIQELAVSKPDAECHGFDISDRMYPRETAPNLQLHLADVKQPFDARWLGYFDVVHVRLIQAAMKKEDWGPAVRNIVTLLKPGGWLQWVEDDRPVAVRHAFRKPAPEGAAERSLMTAGSPSTADEQSGWQPPRFAHLGKYTHHIMPDERAEGMNYGYMNLKTLMADPQVGDLEEVGCDAYLINRRDDGGVFNRAWSMMGIAAARSMFKWLETTGKKVVDEGYDEFAKLCVEDIDKGAQHFCRATVFTGRKRL